MTRAQATAVVLVMLGTFVAALDNTVVGTVMPTVIGDLGGIDRYGWVFSAYLLVSSVTTPVFGKLCDVLGRKRIYLGALVTFVFFSMLCGFARSMDELIVFRALQGLGAGALLPTGFTMIGDLFDNKQRARVQGFFSSVWATSAIVGPTVGGLIAQTLDWRWAFFVNLPIGAIALTLLVFGFKDHGVHRPRPIDWSGAITFAAAMTVLLLALNGALPVVTLVAALALFVIWLGIERRAAEPIIDLAMLRVPLIGTGLALTLITGAVQFGVVTYLPPFVQGVQGRAPVEAGLAVAMMGLAWPAGSVLTGWTLHRVGVRRAALAGAVSVSVGTIILTTLSVDSPLALVVGGAIAIGFGMGCTNLPILVSIQTSVGYAQRGSATSLVRFSRTLGGAIGVAALGAVLTSAIGPEASRIAVLLDPRGDASAMDVAVRETLSFGLHGIYLALAIAALVAVAAATRLPRQVAAPEPPASGTDISPEQAPTGRPREQVRPAGGA